MYVLHFWPDTASLIIRLVMEELGLPFTAVKIDRAGGELDSPSYRAMNPLGQIPAVETPDGPMFETAAILIYLSERHGLAPMAGSPDRAAFLKWLFFTSTNVHTTLLQLFYPERTAGAENVEAVKTQARAKLAQFLAILEGVAQGRPAYLSDQQPSVLGYCIAVLMRWIAADFPSTDYPALRRVLAALETRPAALNCARDEGLGPTIFTQPV